MHHRRLLSFAANSHHDSVPASHETICHINRFLDYIPDRTVLLSVCNVPNWQSFRGRVYHRQRRFTIHYMTLGVIADQVFNDAQD